MNKIRQSFCYPLFQTKGASLLDTFKKAREIGYEATELWGRPPEFDELCAAIKQAGLKIASMAGHASLKDGLNKKENHDRIEAELATSIAIAKQRNIPGLICFSGNRNEGQSDDEAIEVTAAGLRRSAKLAEKEGINLNLELLNSKVDHKDYQCDSTMWGAKVIRKVNSPRVKLLYDIYHMQIMEGDVIRTIRENIDFIGHFHTAGNPGRNDMDDTQELNYRGICKAISNTGYNLFVGHEFLPKADLIQGLRAAYETCHI
jgi:hydroxypyruvate isomerase